MTNTQLAAASNIMLGTTQVDAMYIGSLLMWQQNTVPYDTEIEYLESTGTQWIDTGITPYTNTRVQFKFMNLAVTGDVIVGYYTTDDKTDWRFFNYQQQTYFDIPGSANFGNRIYGSSTYGNAVYEYELGNFYVKDLVTGQYKIGLLNNIEYAGSSTITLNNYSQNPTKSKNRFYYVKIYDGNTLVRDFIPVRIGLVGYMYDRVSRLLFGNDGTGNFTLGPDISGGNISDYVQNGLICHFDGIDKGTGSDWTDLIGGILTTYSGDATKGYPTANSYYFGSGADYLSSGVVSFSTSSDITVEVCYKEDSSMTHCFVFGFGGTADSKLPLFYKDDSYITWSQGTYVYNVSNVGYGDSLTHTMSFNGDNAYHNGIQIPITSTTDYWDVHYGDYRVRIGSAESGGASSNPIRGHVYSIRVYNRKLTSAEQLLNLRVDNLRFGLGLSI